jgi:hypothetical protein
LARLQREAEAVGEEGDRLIAAFLRANPGWLAAHPELYAVLEPPRRLHGEAMADHMAAMLEQARRHGSGAAAGRRAAEGFMQLVQDAVLALMRAPDPVWCLQHDVPGLLRLEGVRLCAEADVPGAARVPVGTVDGVLGQRCALVRDAVRDPVLHGEAAPLARREALARVPLVSPPLGAGPALVALASRDPSGLDGAGTQSLAFLGEAVAAALERA